MAKKREKEKRDCRVSVMLTKDEKELWEYIAKRRNDSLSHTLLVCAGTYFFIYLRHYAKDYQRETGEKVKFVKEERHDVQD